MFLADHGVPCSVGVRPSFLGLYDAPGEMVSVGGRDVNSTMHAVTVKSSDIIAEGIAYNVAIVVKGMSFKARETIPLDDGAFTQILLTKG